MSGTGPPDGGGSSGEDEAAADKRTPEGRTSEGRTQSRRDPAGSAPSIPERAHEAIDRRLPYLMLAPALALVVGVVAYPVLWAIKLSLYEVSVFALDSGAFVGLANYRSIFADPRFLEVVRNTAVFVAASVVGQFALGFGLAVALDGGRIGDRLAGVFRTTYVLPWAVTGVIVGYSWQFVFEPRVGLLNGSLRLLGVAAPPDWLGSVGWAMVAVVVANVWQGTPFSFVFLSSALQSVDDRLYEAAAVGGASRLQAIRHVTLPNLRPFVVMNLLLITLFTVNVFDVIFVMTGGGPLGSTEVLSLYMYETAFETGRFGLASALAVVLFAANAVAVGGYLVVLVRSRVIAR